MIPVGAKLPSTRELASLLEIHRQTVVCVFEELQAQNWIQTIPYRGSFVNDELPVITPKEISSKKDTPTKRNNDSLRSMDHASILKKPYFVINDGFPDERLAPIEALTRAYRTALKANQKYNQSNSKRRDEQVIADYLNTSRGLQSHSDNVLITNGSQMGIYLAANSILSPNDCVLVGRLNYFGANQVFEQIGARLIKVSVDEGGLCVNEVEEICKNQTIKCLYITPHHHHPTTVTLSADRRMKLLHLADKYDFNIIEDDYDYDFHYARSPLLPLASADNQEKVFYIGSMSKNITPNIRFGYIVASSDKIERLSKLRSIIDRRGDMAFMQSIVELIREGEVQRHLKKALKIYRQRRDDFCSLLNEQLGTITSINVPSGGLAVWVNFDSSIDLQEVRKRALTRGLDISNHLLYSSRKTKLNAMRIGFASLNNEEMEDVVHILSDSCSEAFS